VINNIQVDPLSPMDDRSRMQAYRAIYGSPTLNKYAMDPAQPIRITVANGNLTLNGVVDSQADKNVAGIRANGVPGIFKVTNNLQYARKPPRCRKQLWLICLMRARTHPYIAKTRTERPGSRTRELPRGRLKSASSASK
jgi:hypothetical protein